MIIWLASYPRSGNTFFRILLKQLYDVNTPTAYVGGDYTAFEVGKELVGHVTEEWTVEEMAAKPDVLIVKTHRRAPDNYPAIYLHRDGRDSLVSYARKKAEKRPERYYDELKELITTSKSSTGTWGQNVLHWFHQTGRDIVSVSYEELIADPVRVVEQTLRKLNYELPPQNRRDATYTFGDLNIVNRQFFRRGISGSYKDEMPDDLHELFWQQPDHQEAMKLLGYK